MSLIIFRTNNCFTGLDRISYVAGGLLVVAGGSLDSLIGGGHLVVVPLWVISFMICACCSIIPRIKSLENAWQRGQFPLEQLLRSLLGRIYAQAGVTSPFITNLPWVGRLLFGRAGVTSPFILKSSLGWAAPFRVGLPVHSRILGMRVPSKLALVKFLILFCQLSQCSRAKMGRRLPVYAKHRIAVLNQKGKTASEIRRMLLEDDVTTSTRTIRRFLERYATTGHFIDKHRSGRPSGFLHEHLRFIDTLLENDDELTAPDLQRCLAEAAGLHVSLTTVKRIRRKLQWVCTGAKYCQLIKIANRQKRLDFCRLALQNHDTFDNVIFSDGCSIQLDSHSRITFRKKGCPRKLKSRVKHPTKVKVWAGISKRGATPILVFEKIMNGQFYCNDILRDTLKPFIEERFPDGHRFQQDPKHTSKVATTYMKEAEINWWKTPAESPDLNPIENFWQQLKHHLRRRVKPKTKDELVDGICSFWREVPTPEMCTKYINHIQKVIPVVIERNGCASGY